MTTNEEKQLGRAKNAMLTFLENRLIVPKIYLDADWDGHHVDVLAIERDGVGDVHAALLFPCRSSRDGMRNTVDQEQISALVERFSSIPAQFKYIAAVEIDGKSGHVPFSPSNSMLEMLFSHDGIGRIGFLTIYVPAVEGPRTEVEIKPERFRAKIAKLADDYIQHHEADWEIRA